MARKTQNLQVVQDAALDRIAAGTVSRLGPLVPPWLLIGVEAGAGALSHSWWGTGSGVAWAAVACTFSSTLLTSLTWLVTHQRRLLGRVHATLTTTAATGWFTVATITGLAPTATRGALFFGGVTLALSWNIRTVIRAQNGDSAGGGDALAVLFDRAKEQAGLKNVRVRATEVTDHRVNGRMELEPGAMTGDDAIKAAPRIESAMRLPPGSVKVTADRDRADRANVSVSDPRAIEQPVPWPGPSHPGASVDDPLRVGLYQDGDYVLYRFVGHHLQINGMTGSGKSIGGAWGIIGELITRTDAAVFSIDISKDDQTMGPLKPALHRFETSINGAVELIRAMHAEIPKRTKWLSEHGYSAWEKGCGLAYWYLHIEELAKLYDALSSDDGEKLEQIMKEIRSAGGSVLLSLQRSDYTQIPTILRSQMSKMCFGLSDPDDVKYAVSARQRKADVAPHEWETHYPGMALLDGPSIRATHYAMPLRTWTYGTSSGQARQVMTAHAAAYPATDRPGDPFTRTLSRIPQDTPAPALPLPAPTPDFEGEQMDAQEATHAEYAADFAELLADAARLVIARQNASTALLSDALRVPAQDASRLLEALQRKGVVDAPGSDSGWPVLVAADAEGVENLVANLQHYGDVVTAALRTDDPDPTITATPDQVIQDPTPIEANGLTTPEQDERPKLSPEQSRALVMDWLTQRATAGNQPFRASDPDFTRIREQTGNSRPWAHKVLAELVARHILTKSGGDYTITDPGTLTRNREPIPA